MSKRHGNRSSLSEKKARCQLNVTSGFSITQKQTAGSSNTIRGKGVKPLATSFTPHQVRL